jgi:hypothetical protein
MENPIKIEKALPAGKGGKGEEGEEAEGTGASVRNPGKSRKTDSKTDDGRAAQDPVVVAAAAKNARLNGVSSSTQKLPAMVTLYSQICRWQMNWLNSRKC